MVKELEQKVLEVAERYNTYHAPSDMREVAEYAFELGIKKAEEILMREWDEMESRGVKFCVDDSWRNYKFVRNSIRDILKKLLI